MIFNNKEKKSESDQKHWSRDNSYDNISGIERNDIFGDGFNVCNDSCVVNNMRIRIAILLLILFQGLISRL
jgi:hypothetical protein